MPFPDDIDANNLGRLDRLKIAYGLHVSRKVMEADEILDMREIELLMDAFPESLLRACGFIDDTGGLTAEWKAQLTEGAALLPIEMSLTEKLDMLTLFHRIRAIDDEIDEREDSVVAAAAQQLGVTRGQLAAHLKKLGL